MRNYKEHLIIRGSSLKQALSQLNELAKDAILFVVDEENKLLGSLTDGDVRRGLLKGYSSEDLVDVFVQEAPKYVSKSNYSLHEIIVLRENNFKVIPVVDTSMRVVNVINFRFQKSYLPMDALVMAGGRGSRLRPMTDKVPKPLLKVGDKAIIDHNIDRLKSYGVDDFHISVRYLGEQLEEHCTKTNTNGVKLHFIWEDEPLGTIGAASKVDRFHHDCVLVTNSDILTTLDYEDFFLDFLEKEADMAVATIPYQVNIPYAVMETTNNHVVSFKEKPTYIYYSNGGIYIIKKEVLSKIPKDTFFNATDLMEQVIQEGGKLVSYPIRQYWLDIGKPEDFEKAQNDIKHLNL
ncbi:nucleotidyltransferase family protein [Lewinella cohaerens]|uniref:nucleotidyltransferase family protein n=1 Tax=Lewinella cohaerens TaxID=70995 RepID=UPI00036C8E19|nr:nucleotidyltransferase family protein [Lewinella cohaerens]